MINAYSLLNIIVATGLIPVLLGCLIALKLQGKFKWLWIACFVLVGIASYVLREYHEHLTQDYQDQVRNEWENAERFREAWWQDREQHATNLARITQQEVATVADSPLPKPDSPAYRYRQALLLAAKLGAFIVEEDSHAPKPPSFSEPWPGQKQLLEYKALMNDFSAKRLIFDANTAEVYLKNYGQDINALLVPKIKDINLFYARHYCVPTLIPQQGTKIMPLAQLEFCANALRSFGLQQK